MTTIKLRPAQQKGFDDLSSLIKSGKRRLIAVAPPGFGKTTLFSAIIASAVSKGRRVVIAIHKKELVYNAVDRLKNQFGIDAGIIMAGHPVDKRKLVQIGSIQTMIRRDLSWLRPDLYMVDEGHRLLTGSHLKMYDKWVCPDKSERAIPMIIWTATPVRTDSKRKFEDYCDHILQLSTYRQEMENRNLVDTKVFCPDGSASLDGVKIRMSFGEMDYDTQELSDRFSEERVLKGLYSHWKKHANGLTTMVFCVDKRHNIASYKYFLSKGVSCAYVDEDTPQHERDEIVSRFKKGPFTDNPLTVLFNINLFGEGLDAEYTRCVILNFATKSFTKYVQSAARGSRPCWNSDYSDWLRMENGKYYKDKVIILDFGNNTVTHGMIPDYDAFGFDLSGKKKKGEAPTKICKQCRSVVYASYRICPECEYVFPIEKKADDKKFSDEIELKEMDATKSIQNMVAKMTPKQIWEADTAWLRVIALCKGHPALWPSVILEKRNEIPWFDKSKESQKYLFQYLEEKEIEKGTHKTYLELRERRVYK